MRITWDAEARAIYIELPCALKRKSAKTVKLYFHSARSDEPWPPSGSPSGLGGSAVTVRVHSYDVVYLDYNEAHELIGIEILNVDEPIIENLVSYPSS